MCRQLPFVYVGYKPSFSTRTVSYTHLDVYKRQVILFSVSLAANYLIQPFCVVTTKPKRKPFRISCTSNTNTVINQEDVYKRQHLL